MNITINGRPVEAKEGERLLTVAQRHGIEIPHYCYHHKLSTPANCRMCLVKVVDVPKLMPACTVSVAANMKVETEAPEVMRARQAVLQFQMLNHPVDCGICDKAGECKLQDYQFAYGVPRSRSDEPKHHKRKLHDLSDRIQLDNERCILCSRCVRFTREISKSNALGIVDRGGHSYVERTGPDGLHDPYSDNVIGLCPTGALLSRDFFYKSRTWYLEPVRSVCTGCARGCSVNVWRRKEQWRLRMFDDGKNVVYRITAYSNPDINGPWLCNKGFDLHKSMARERALQPMLRGAPAPLDAALAQAGVLLAEAKRPAAFASAQASNEELEALASLAATVGERLTVYVREDCQPAPGEVIEDDLLIKADKNPNSFTARQRFGTAGFAPGNGNHDVILLWGECQDYTRFGEATLIHLAPYATQGPRQPEVFIPLSTSFERSGTFCNFEGKVNRFEKVFDKPPGVQHAQDVFARLVP